MGEDACACGGLDWKEGAEGGLGGGGVEGGWGEQDVGALEPDHKIIPQPLSAKWYAAMQLNCSFRA